jgi:hypothetical protein
MSLLRGFNSFPERKNFAVAQAATAAMIDDGLGHSVFDCKRAYTVPDCVPNSYMGIQNNAVEQCSDLARESLRVVARISSMDGI